MPADERMVKVFPSMKGLVKQIHPSCKHPEQKLQAAKNRAASNEVEFVSRRMSLEGAEVQHCRGHS
jgi:hypothetical protein